MVRLTAALVQECPQVTTPLGERALVVRGRNIQQLESFATGTAAAGTKDDAADDGPVRVATTDLLFEIACNFDVLDLSENSLQRLDGFNFPARPANVTEWTVAPRLSTLILHNNAVNRLSAGLVRSLAPTLHTFVAHNNAFRELAELDVFGGFPNLERLALVGNPVATKPQYRAYVIGVCGPKLKLLDYNRVLDRERVEAAQLRSALEAEGKAKKGTTGRTQRRRGAAALFDDDAGGALAALEGSNGDVAAAEANGKRPRDDAAEAAPARAQPAAEPQLSAAELSAKLAETMERLDAATDPEEMAALEAEADRLIALGAA
mmetsp:Transcript_34736/g.107271  ORF Transcript_34736/g.107271 Transcript_34736/m.107271 type:complete len:320 (-) Transcript_34736:30-989(-)